MFLVSVGACQVFCSSVTYTGRRAEAGSSSQLGPLDDRLPVDGQDLLVAEMLGARPRGMQAHLLAGDLPAGLGDGVQDTLVAGDRQSADAVGMACVDGHSGPRTDP